MGLMGLELTEHSGLPANMDNLGILQPLHQNTTDNCGQCPFCNRADGQKDRQKIDILMVCVKKINH